MRDYNSRATERSGLKIPNQKTSFLLTDYLILNIQNSGERLSIVRKRKGLSQAEVGKTIGINGDAYGRYERNEVRPTIEMATKISEAQDLFRLLSWKTDLKLDNTMISRIQEVTKLPDKDKEHIFITLDALIRDFKNKQAFGI